MGSTVLSTVLLRCRLPCRAPLELSLQFPSYQLPPSCSWTCSGETFYALLETSLHLFPVKATSPRKVGFELCLLIPLASQPTAARPPFQIPAPLEVLPVSVSAPVSTGAHGPWRPRRPDLAWRPTWLTTSCPLETSLLFPAGRSSVSFLASGFGLPASFRAASPHGALAARSQLRPASLLPS